MTHSHPGFTFIELIVAIGMIFILTFVAATNLIGSLNRTSVDNTLELLIGDIHAQQIKAMSLQADSLSQVPGYGICLESNQYTLFRGSAYDSSEINNFTVTLDPTVTLTATFPGSGPCPSSIIFSPGSGEISSYSFATSLVTLTPNTDSNPHTLQFNKYGLIISQN